MTVLFDTHTHLQLSAFDSDRDEAVRRAIDASVQYMVVCGDDPPSCQGAFDLADKHDAVLPTAGYHPHEAANITEEHFAMLRDWSQDGRCMAIGEIGLDYYRELSPRDVQRRVLEKQLDLAVERALPVLVHSRGAEDEIAELLEPYAGRSPLRGTEREVGIMHCFGGTLEQARRYVDMGFLVSLACTVTYPKNEEARRIAAELPMDKLVIETDSPFLPPQERRGKRNEPAFVSAGAQAIAGARGVSFDEVADATTRNALRLFAVEARNEAVPA
jgi:TatD DNase family protein